MSRVDFDTRYELDTDASGYAIITDAEGVGITGPFVKAGFVKDKGGVTATGTRNLTWQIGADEVWSIIAAGNAGKTIGVRVTYKPKTGYNIGNVYFEFYAKIDVANISDKIVPSSYLVSNYWDDKLTYFRVNVKTPDATASTPNDVFDASLWQGFDQTKVESLLPNAIKATYAFEFAPAKDQDAVAGYTFSLSADKLTLKANGSDVATIDPTTFIIKFANTAVAQQLLAKKDGFFARVKLCATTCSGYHIELGEYADFKAGFICPIKMETKSGVAFKDGADISKSTIEAKEIITLTDWRGNAFATNPGYFAWYGVTEYILDVAGAETNLGGTRRYLAGTDLSLVAVNSGLNSVVTYTNVGVPVTQEFEIYLPVKVVYYCGTVEDTITILVEPTI